MHSSDIKIAIVGMGATGAAACAHLLERAGETSRRLTIHTYEASRRLGEGLAYSTQEDCHRLNMRAETMSLFADIPHDFSDWLSQSGADHANGYVPRRLFGRYLRERLAELEHRAARRGVVVEHRRAEVTNCWTRPRGAAIALAGEVRAYDRVLLCMGYVPGALPQALRDNPRFFPSPWERAQLATIGRGSRVGILGSGLTAVDAVLSLCDAGIGQTLRCFSRRRGLPKVQPPASNTPVRLRHLTMQTLEALTQRGRRKLELETLARLLLQELSQSPGGALLGELLTEDLERLRRGDAAFLPRDSLNAERGLSEWYRILDAAGELAPQFWRHLESEAKRRFLAEHESYWAMFRHCMPLPTAQRLVPMVEAGRLQVHAGTKGFEYDAGAEQFRVELESSAGRCYESVDYLIDARGAELRPECLDSPLIQDGLARGAFTASPYGGIDVDFDTCRVIDAHGERSHSVYFVGPLTRGVHFYTNSFSTNRDNAIRAICAMLDDVVEPRSSGARSDPDSAMSRGFA